MYFDSLKQRLFSRVTKTDTCWLWTGPLNNMGYGRIYVHADIRRSKYVHVVSFFLHYDRWANPCVLHRCDNPRCVNPEHLFEGTKKDNSKDMASKGRSGFQKNPATINNQIGERNSCGKLTERTIREIRDAVAGGELQKSVANRLGISRANVCLIVNRKAWPHIA